jgi:wyosine [tRNA(Phe)-imidazoG37] synthetase (radical SAM superfamily)
MNKWYCPVPFKSASVNPTGYYTLCCVAKVGSEKYHLTKNTMSEFISSDWLSNIKNKFNSKDINLLEDDEIKNVCISCIKREQSGFKSKRIREMETIKPPYLEFKLGNICNLECVMCNSYSSSKIAEKEGLSDKYPKYIHLTEEWYEDFKKIAPQYGAFRFSGGEPFMAPSMKRILKCLEEIGHTNVILWASTNGSPSKKVIEGLCKKFKRVSITVSVEAWGNRNDIIRIGSTWDFMHSRIIDYLDLAKKYPNFRITYTPAVSIVNIGYLHLFTDFVNEIKDYSNATFSVSNAVATPIELNAFYLPNDIKKYYLEKNENFLNMKHVKNGKTILKNLQTELINEKDFSASIEFLNKKIPTWREWYPEFLPYDT